MFGFVRRRLVLKFGVLMLTTVAAGFFGSAALSARSQRHAMEQAHDRAARLFARGLAAGVRSSMLTGDPLATREMLAQAKRGLGNVRVRVFAPGGDEVFAPLPPPPNRATLPPELRAALETSHAQRTQTGDDVIPIAHEPRCTTCHELGNGLRGVLQIGATNAPRAARTPDAVRLALTTAVRAGFLQIMTARRSDHLDEYFDELRQRAPDVRAVTVFNARGDPAFGDASVEDTYPEVTAAAVAQLVTANTPRTIERDDATIQIFPMENETRCHSCHRPAQRMRGAIAIVTRHAADDAVRPLAQISELSVRHIMLSGLGRLTTGFLDVVASTGALGSLRLFDPQGRVYHDAIRHPPPPPRVAAVLQNRARDIAAATHDPGHESFILVSGLRNEPACARCHGGDRPLRGALEIVIDTSVEASARNALARRTMLFGLLTILVVFAALYVGTRVFIDIPVSRLSVVADRVGRGQLDVEAVVTSTDEIGRLAGRLNEMVFGLRQRVELSKFVSQSTVAAVELGTRGGVVRRGGERRHIVVLFSDVRGFTSFSESREPEEVVAMLNAYLQRQTEVVHKHGGDIDKFVGDELMALFDGPDAELRAVRCAVEMVTAVDALNRERGIEAVAIGVGVSAGPAVVGAMGAEERMDFTAIGDTVNLGARLCSNAAGGQVLISASVRDRVAAAEGLTIERLEPLKVKGKAQPVDVYAVK